MTNFTNDHVSFLDMVTNLLYNLKSITDIRLTVGLQCDRPPVKLVTTLYEGLVKYKQRHKGSIDIIKLYAIEVAGVDSVCHALITKPDIHSKVVGVDSDCHVLITKPDIHSKTVLLFYRSTLASQFKLHGVYQPEGETMTETKKEDLTIDALIQMATRYVTYLGKPSKFNEREYSLALDCGVVRLTVETDGNCTVSQSGDENTLRSDEEGLDAVKNVARHYIDRAQALKESPFTRLKFDDSVPLSEHAERIRQATKALKD